MRGTTRLALAVAICATAAACGTEPTAPAASEEWPAFDRVNRTERFPIAGVTFNACPPMEPIAYEGFLHISQHGNVEPGSTDMKTRVVVHGEGVGLLTGSRYTVQSNQKSDFSFSSQPLQQESSSSVYTRFIRQGSEDNFYLEASFKVVCDATGCRVVENEQERTCRG